MSPICSWQIAHYYLPAHFIFIWWKLYFSLKILEKLTSFDLYPIITACFPFVEKVKHNQNKFRENESESTKIVNIMRLIQNTLYLSKGIYSEKKCFSILLWTVQLLSLPIYRGERGGIKLQLKGMMQILLLIYETWANTIPPNY